MSTFPVSTHVFLPAAADGSASAETAAAQAGRGGKIDQADKADKVATALLPLGYC